MEVRAKQALTRLLMNQLPADEQARMVSSLVDWVYADLPLAERQKIVWVEPRLADMMHQGRFGLRLLVYTHLLRLPPLRWLKPVGVPTAGQRMPSAFSRTGATSSRRYHVESDHEAVFGHVL
jgi:hypothetical protein